MKDNLAWEKYGEYSYLPCNSMNSDELKKLRESSTGDYPHIVNFAITWKCNSKCKMCNIWKEKSKKEISIEKVKEIFSDKLFKKTKLVKITGGEPTLHSHIHDIIKIISEKTDARISINTNAYPLERIKKVVDECIKIRKDLIFSIGLDGIGDVHNYIRGRECFEEVMKSINYLEDLKKKTEVKVRFSFTITPWNYSALPEVVKFAEKKGTYIGFRIMHLDRLYRNEDIRLKLNGEFLNNIKPILKEHGTNYFKINIAEFGAKFGGSKRKVNCYAFINSVFIDPDGEFHPCLYRKSLDNGNLCLSKVWKSEKAKEIREEIKNCSKCWSDCQTVPNIIAEFGEFI